MSKSHRKRVVRVVLEARVYEESKEAIAAVRAALKDAKANVRLVVCKQADTMDQEPGALRVPLEQLEEGVRRFTAEVLRQKAREIEEGEAQTRQANECRDRPPVQAEAVVKARQKLRDWVWVKAKSGFWFVLSKLLDLV
jgi:hypothetical protein